MSSSNFRHTAAATLSRNQCLKRTAYSNMSCSHCCRAQHLESWSNLLPYNAGKEHSQKVRALQHTTEGKASRTPSEAGKNVPRRRVKQAFGGNTTPDAMHDNAAPLDAWRRCRLKQERRGGMNAEAAACSTMAQRKWIDSIGHQSKANTMLKGNRRQAVQRHW